MAEAYELSSKEPRSSNNNNNNECNANEHQTLHDEPTAAQQQQQQLQQQQQQQMYYQQSGQPHPVNQSQNSHMNERPMEIPAAKVRRFDINIFDMLHVTHSSFRLGRTRPATVASSGIHFA